MYSLYISFCYQRFSLACIYTFELHGTWSYCIMVLHVLVMNIFAHIFAVVNFLCCIQNIRENTFCFVIQVIYIANILLSGMYNSH